LLRPLVALAAFDATPIKASALLGVPIRVRPVRPVRAAAESFREEPRPGCCRISCRTIGRARVGTARDLFVFSGFLDNIAAAIIGATVAGFVFRGAS
jgi:hypothetical protein